MKKPKQIKGLPYMGGKAKISNLLFDKMLELNPQATTFVDVFGGGGSMSLRALDRLNNSLQRAKWSCF